MQRPQNINFVSIGSGRVLSWHAHYSLLGLGAMFVLSSQFGGCTSFSSEGHVWTLHLPCPPYDLCNLSSFSPGHSSLALSTFTMLGNQHHSRFQELCTVSKGNSYSLNNASPVSSAPALSTSVLLPSLIICLVQVLYASGITHYSSFSLWLISLSILSLSLL
jgi:hypothetical protein